MNAGRKRVWSHGSTGLVVVVLLVGVVFELRSLGLLQRPEFLVYDLLVKQRARVAVEDPRIVFLEISEADIQDSSLGWPVPDDKLARLLDILAAQEPAAIGLDLFRDLPVPSSGEHIEKLNHALRRHRNVVMTWKFGDSFSPTIPAPAVLQTEPQRIGFNDIPVDNKVDEKVRRGLLFLDDGHTTYESFALRLALLYLEHKGVFPQPGATEAAHLRLGKTTFRPLERNDGAYVNTDARGYQFLLDFKGPQRFDAYSIRDALSGRLPPNALRGKIVLVGVTAVSVKDSVATPIRFDHRGIEVHAQIVDQLLRAALNGDQPMRVWREWQELLFLFGWCVLGTAIGLWVRVPWRAAALMLLSLLALGFTAWAAFHNGLWIPPVTPAIGCIGSAGMMTWWVSHREQTQRRLLMKVFAAHVSPDMADAIWAQRDAFLEGDRPRPQKLTATILFADIADFASCAEEMDPGVLLEWLNEFMGAMAKVIERNGGLVEKFIGDAVMAGFGIPVPRATQEQIRRDAANAVRCALAMEQELRRLNPRWKERGFPDACMRIGIATGPLVVGSLGSAERLEYTVLGDTVNTASRLEGFDKDNANLDVRKKPCRILVAESTLALLDGKFETEGVGRIRLKGRKEEVMVCRAIRETHSLERNLP